MFTWRELYDAGKEMSTAVGVKKPREAQKAKALWKMKAAKDAGEEYNDPTHKDFRGRNETRLALWEGHPKDPIVTLDKDADLGGRLALLGSDGQFVCVCVFTHSVHGVECAREVWAAWRAHFLPYTEGSGDGQGSETFSPFINADIRTHLFSADVLKEVCAYRLARNCGRRKRR